MYSTISSMVFSCFGGGHSSYARGTAQTSNHELSTQIDDSFNLNEVNYLSNQINRLEKRSYKLQKQIFETHPKNASETTVVACEGEDQSKNLAQRLDLLRTQLLDLGCVITADMTEKHIGVEKLGKTNHSVQDIKATLRAQRSFLVFLESQANFNHKREWSSNPIKADVQAFLHTISICRSGSPQVLALNIRLAILRSKYLDLESKLQSFRGSSEVHQSNFSARDSMHPDLYAIALQINQVNQQIDKAPLEEIKRIDQVIAELI